MDSSVRGRESFVWHLDRAGLQGWVCAGSEQAVGRELIVCGRDDVFMSDPNQRDVNPSAAP